MILTESPHHEKAPHHEKPVGDAVTRRLIEIESLADFDAHISRTRQLNGWFVQSVDLTERADVLTEVDPRGAVFLGCLFTPTVEHSLRRSGALLFPRLPDLPFDPYRAQPYDALELYGTDDYASSLDAMVYAWSHAQPIGSLAAELSTTLHDHSITDALDDVTSDLESRSIVGIMGGHAVPRGDSTYRAAAELGAILTAAGRTVLTGGGPGAMEAANLGAYLSAWPGSLDEALTIMKPTPSYRPSIDAWAHSAFRIRARWPIADSGRSLSIPTWFYGHEPTNVRHRDRQVFLQRAAGGHFAEPLQGRRRLPSRAGRHRTGNLPSCDGELLRRRCQPHCSTDLGGPSALDRHLPCVAIAATAR
jgi:hypothetical protein